MGLFGGLFGFRLTGWGLFWFGGLGGFVWVGLVGWLPWVLCD